MRKVITIVKRLSQTDYASHMEGIIKNLAITIDRNIRNNR